MNNLEIQQLKEDIKSELDKLHENSDCIQIDMQLDYNEGVVVIDGESVLNGAVTINEIYLQLINFELYFKGTQVTEIQNYLNK